VVLEVDLVADRQAVAGWAGRHWRLLVLGGLVGLLVVLPLVLLMGRIGLPSLLLLVCVVSGYGLTYLSGLELVVEERLVFGTVLGAMAVAAIGFAIASLDGLTAAGVVVDALLALAVSAAGWLLGRDRLLPELRELVARWTRSPAAPGHPWPLLLVALVAGFWVYRIFTQAYRWLPDGLYAGNGGVWADWAAHLSYAGSFAYGANFPPQLPIDPGHHLTYPFMVDFLAASLVPLGASLPESLVLTSGLLSFVFAPLMYLAGLRLTGSRPVAALAPFLFALSGGLGFVYLVVDLDKQGWAALVHLPQQFSQIDADNYQWLAPVLASMIPQRSTLFGFSIVLIVLALLFTAARSGGWQPFLFAGVVAGLTPAFHVHAYGTCVALAAFWAAFDRRREWLAYFAPALVLGVPVVLWLLPEGANSIRFHVGWLAIPAGTRPDLVVYLFDLLWFWLKNLGLFIPMLLVAQFSRGLLPTPWARYFAPVWLWFLVPNLFLLHPWDWDNQKFFVYWALLGSFLVAALVVRVARAGLPGAAAAAFLVVVLCLAGGLDATRYTDLQVVSNRFVDTPGVEAAAWARTHTDPRAVFLTASDHDSAIPTLGGRRVVLGYPGWIWTYGISDWYSKGQDVQTMLQGGVGTAELVRQYHVSYVVIGPQERQSPFSASDSYWAAHGTLVYSNSEYHVYRLG
jgi:hypothetical protein